MLFDLLLFVVGLAALYYGSEYLVDGASRLATSFGVLPFIIGLTVVAFGTSAPELLVSAVASYNANGAIAVGNVVGSNVANIALILGVAALIRPFDVHRDALVRDVPLMIGVSILLLVLSWTGTLARWEALLLLVIFAGYMLHLLRGAKTAGAHLMAAGEIPSAEPGSRLRSALIAAGGLVALVVGAQLLVDSAVSIALTFGVSQTVIGITLVAFGTSVPELATTIAAARRGEAQIIFGNLIGSNIFNICLVGGVSALIRPLPIDPPVLRFDLPVMIGLSLAVPLLSLRGMRMNRWAGGLLLASYVVFIGITVMF